MGGGGRGGGIARVGDEHGEGGRTVYLSSCTSTTTTNSPVLYAGSWHSVWWGKVGR